MPARLILIYYFGVPARFIYKRWQQLGLGGQIRTSRQNAGRQLQKKYTD